MTTRRAKLSVTNSPIDDRTLNDYFHALERIAKIDPLPGRGCYGIRRRATEVYEDYEKDERVLNGQTGHKKSETRREVYQERERETVRAKSAETRRLVHSKAFGQHLIPGNGTDAADLRENADAAETILRGLVSRDWDVSKVVTAMTRLPPYPRR